METKLKYRRVLIKLSGEALAGDKKTGVCYDTVLGICKKIKEVHDLGLEIGIVVGGGNFWRGKQNEEFDRATADYIGMLATTMNALTLNDTFRQLGADSRVQTAIEMRQVAEFYIKGRAHKHLDKKRIVIFGCGTGSPFFTTDTAAALKAAEIHADALIKATNVDGVYDSDPKTNKDAKKYDEISYLDVLNKKLKVMDSTSTTMCMDNDIPIIVVNINNKNDLKKAILGEKVGTIIK